MTDSHPGAPREHSPAPWLAAVCDQGLIHPTNEDDVALTASGDYGVLVVCDGVSTAPDSATAARTASSLVADQLQHPGTATAQRDRLVSAIADANRAVGRLNDTAEHPPACTIAAAVVDDRTILAGWVGDSRVYWLPDDGPAELLTVDDSMAQLRIEWGVERATAEASAGAHTIVRWLGRGAPEEPAHTAVHPVTAPGWVVACSDGLWNYASEPDALAAVVASTAAPGGTLPAIDLARGLVAWANEQGGADNITAAVARLRGPST